MATTFTRARRVAVDEEITSTQAAAYAAAWNDRLRAGFDFWERIHYGWLNLFRQMRRPDESGMRFPAQAEFFHLGQALDPEYAQGWKWPTQPPGEPEGANLANPLCQLVFGVSPTLDREDVRLSGWLPVWLGAGPPETLRQTWELRKLQCGASDPVTGYESWPAGMAAQAHWQIVNHAWTPHGKTYGGWFPTPLLMSEVTDPPVPDECGSSDPSSPDNGQFVPNYQIMFTAARADVATEGLHGTVDESGDTPVLTYAGSCPCGTEYHASGHVVGIVYTRLNFYVVTDADAGGTCASYNVDKLPVSDWVEGPYEGPGDLQHDDGRHLDRVMHAFVMDFRGTPGQRTPDDFDIEAIGFDLQKFLETQNLLAPNVGHLEGDGLVPDYPHAHGSPHEHSLLIQARELLRFAGGGTSHVYHEGFTCCGFFAEADGLAGDAVLEVMSGEDVIGSLILRPDPGGHAEAYVMRQRATRPDPLSVRAGSEIRFTSALGRIDFEATEQVEVGHQFWDAYPILRLGSTAGGTAEQGAVDTRGIDYQESRELSEQYFALGCILSRNGVAGVRDVENSINDNPLYDAARRQCREHVRQVRRHELVGYEVQEGKAALYFRRFGYGMHNERVDLFEGIAPPIDPISDGNLEVGETYIVKGASPGDGVWHGGKFYADGELFTASGKSMQMAGGGLAYQYDGIRHVAREKGWTREWILGFKFHCYHPSESSIWKPEAYGDYFPMIERCMFYTGWPGTWANTLKRHMTYNYKVDVEEDHQWRPQLSANMALQADFVAPEAPSGYRYAGGANTVLGGTSADHYPSCRIYEPPVEVESCIVHDWSENQVVKVTLRTRPRTHPNAPESVDLDPNEWPAGDVDKLRMEAVSDNETYRTEDNALREYCLWVASAGQKNCVFRPGDCGTYSGITGTPDNPYGACLPIFFFTRLLPSPREDEDNISDWEDARCLVDQIIQGEVYTAFGCEACVDGETSRDVLCRKAHALPVLYDYKLRNLCHEAFGGVEFAPVPVDVGMDPAAGYGPVPNTIMYAEVFNQLVDTVNLLCRFRIDVPLVFKSRGVVYQDTTNVALIYTSGSDPCAEVSSQGGYVDAATAARASTPSSTESWVEAPTVSAYNSGYIATSCPWHLFRETRDAEYMVQVASGFEDVIPEHVQELIDGLRTSYLVNFEATSDWYTRQSTAPGGGDTCLGIRPWGDLHWEPESAEVVTWCDFLTSGTLEPPAPPRSDFAVYRRSDGMECHTDAGSEIVATLLNEQSAFVEVPLEDYDDPAS